MRLEYRILWFEDQPDNTKYHEDRIRNGLARLGFEPNVDMRVVVAGSGDPLANLPAQHDVDLVLMDWKLGGGHDGATVARGVRRSFRDTDIVFYSSEAPQALRKLIFDQDIDGVYCFHRTSLSERTMGLIRSQMRKVLDLNHMRGIVMAATSDLDQAMIQCLEIVQAIVYPTGAEVFAADIGAQVAHSLRSKAEDIDKLARKGRLDKLLHEPAFGAALRLTVLQTEIKKIADRINEIHLIEGLNRYQSEVITPRNDFAHRRAVIQGGKLVLEGRQEPFDQDGMIALRLKLLNHSDNLRALLSLLKEMADAAGEPALAAQIAGVEELVQEASKAGETQMAGVASDGSLPRQ
ncbi:response regulator [Methylobacterium segetis]|uniref:response regulator n=1 Tax=Methylobacterium segetis TaxID=2488750 RepID=UPI00104F3EF2|nr:response regulator [Methylobacterium segetis]